MKNKLHHKFMTIGSSHYECKPRWSRNRLNALLKYGERQYFADLLVSNKSNMIKELLQKTSRFFVNIGNNLAKPIPIVKILPCRYIGDIGQQPLFLDPVTPEEITKIIKSLKMEHLSLMKSIPSYYSCHWLQQWCHYLSCVIVRVMSYCLITTALCPYNEYYQRSLKRSCIPDYLISGTIKES